MQSELIESVRALAEAQLAWAGSEDGGSIEFEAAVLAADFPALLAALERAERIEKAARTIGALGRALPPEITADARFDAIDEAVSALDAALSEPQ